MKSAQHEEKSVWHESKSESDGFASIWTAMGCSAFPDRWKSLWINWGERVFFLSQDANNAKKPLVMCTSFNIARFLALGERRGF